MNISDREMFGSNWKIPMNLLSGLKVASAVSGSVFFMIIKEGEGDSLRLS